MNYIYEGDDDKLFSAHRLLLVFSLIFLLCISGIARIDLIGRKYRYPSADKLFELHLILCDICS